MALQFENNIAILSLEGKIDSYNSCNLESSVEEAFNTNAEQILIDFEKLVFISSSGLRILLQALKKANKENVKLILYSLNENISEVFHISGFSSIFSVYKNKEEYFNI